MLELIFNNRAFIQYVLVGMALVLAFKIGGWPERLCALSVAGITLLDVAYHFAFMGRESAERDFVFHLALDLAGLFAILWIALQANRKYPLWLTALQGVSFLIHIARDVDPETEMAAYLLLNVLPYYLMIAILMGGTVVHWKTERRHGPYRSWRNSSHPG